jgi:hypothetical protein
LPLPENGAPPVLMLPISTSLRAVAAAPFWTVTLLVWVGSLTWTIPKSTGDVVRTLATAAV